MGFILRSMAWLFLASAFALPGFASATTGHSGGVSARPVPAAAKKIRNPVRFRSPILVAKPKALLGDSGDGRCPDPSQVCFKDTDDLLFGRRNLFRTDDLVLAYQSGAVQMFTQDSAVVSTTSETLTDGSNNYTQPIVVGARVFATAADVAVTLVQNRSQNTLQWTLQGQSGQLAAGQIPLPAQLSDPNSFLNVVAGDFTGDGLDEVAVFLTVVGYNGSAIVATAQDPGDPSKGLKFGPPLAFTGPSPGSPGGAASFDHIEPLSITKATVVGQPRVFVAGPSNYYNTACPSLHSGLAFESYTVDPQSLALASAGTFAANIPEGNTACLESVNITSGRFSTGTRDQLAVVYGAYGSNHKAFAFDLNTQGFAVQGPVFDTGAPVNVGWAGIVGGRFAWNSPVDQAALFIANGFNVFGINSLRIVKFDQNLNITQATPIQAGNISGMCASQVLAGNFNRTRTNPTPPPASFADPNLQVAIAFSDCGNTEYLRIFDVDPADFTLSQHSEYQLNPGASVWIASVAAVDLQGRSLRVGPPTKITIENHDQAQVILAAPPMHVDGVQPVSGGAQGALNITATPDGFYATYSLSNADDYKTQTTTSNTWSFGAKETVEDKGEIGSCELGDCVDFGFKASAQQALDGSKGTVTGNFATVTDSMTGQTGFSDKVYYKGETLTIYAYPVIGRTVCPSSKPTCADSEKVPMVVNMAGPDTVTAAFPQANILTWYQPPWMPGNILSYPGNLDQLKAAAFPGDTVSFQNLGQAIQWFTGDGGDSASLSWNNGGVSGSTASLNQNYSFDLDISVSGKMGVGGLDTVSAGLDLDLSGSFGFTSLTDTTTTLAKTQGIQFTRKATFGDTNYGYFVTPYIFGQSTPGGVVDDKPLSTDVQTFGALRMGHVVSFDNCGACGFWKSWYGQAPDVGLNQPMHWQSTRAVSDPNDGSSCRSYDSGSSDLDCVKLGDRLPGTTTPIWMSEFHWMRGFFIQGVTGTGPQLTVATTGDRLTLTARVYNFSLDPDISPSARVRFMATPWNTGKNIPAGPSFQIGEQTAGPIPPFNSDSPNPNWIMVPQPFDTSGTNCGGKSCDNQDLAFWVAVWAVDGSGNPLTELPEHGLTGIPAAGAEFTTVAGAEQTYSNNLGLYNQVFHIFSKTAAAAAAVAKPKREKPEVGARLTHMGRSQGVVRLGRATAVAARVKTGSRPLASGLKVHFYDGHPDRGGRLFGLQTLPYLKARGVHDFRVVYRPQECGRHLIFAQVGDGTRHEHLGRLPAIRVTCNRAERRRFPGRR